MSDRNFENITITMTKKDKKAIRQIALDNDCSVSELVRRWLSNYKNNAKEDVKHESD